MSKINELINTIKICCPNCKEIVSVYDVDVSVTVENHDICRPKLEGVTTFKCNLCKGNVVLIAQLDIFVSEFYRGIK